MGYSLVELIVVIAIMTVFAGGAGFGLSMMFSRDAQRVAKVIDDELSEVRMNTMSTPGKYTMVIHSATDTSDNYIRIDRELEGTITSKTINFDKRANIMITNSDTAVEGLAPYAADTDIAIVFDKSNGSVKKVTVEGTELSGDAYYIKCQSVRNTSKTAVVKLLTVTGRHSID